MRPPRDMLEARAVLSRPPAPLISSDRTVMAAALAALLVAAALHLFFLLRGFYSISWDEAGRILDAYNWAFHDFTQVPAWLPFYRVVVGSALKLAPDLVFTPRLVTAVFGLAVIPAIAWLAHELFQDRRTTLIALAGAAVFSQRLALGLAPLSSIMFGFLIVMAMAFFARWLRREDLSSLWFSCLWLALAGTARYEGWVFAAVLFACLLLWRLRGSASLGPTRLLLAGLILFTFPCVNTATNALADFQLIDVVRADSARQPPAEVLLRNPLTQFVLANGWSLNLLGLLAVVGSFRSPDIRVRLFVVAAFGPLLVTSLVLLLIFSGQSGPAWRMIAVWSFLLLPFTARLLSGLWGAKLPAWAPLLASGAVLSFFLIDTFRIERDSRWAFTRSERKAGAYLKSIFERDPQAKVLIDSRPFNYLNIFLASQHPDRFVLNSPPHDYEFAQRFLEVGGDAAAAFEKAAVSQMMFVTTDFKSFLDQSPAVSRVAEFEKWSIYEPSRDAPPPPPR